MRQFFSNSICCGLLVQVFLALTMLFSLQAQAQNNSMRVVPFETLQFSPKEPGWPQIAPVMGNPEKGASSIVMKMGRGAFPLHTHTSDYQLVVIKGTMKHWGANQSQAQAVSLLPGSYWYQPAQEVHGDSCESEECVWFISFQGPRDFALANVAK